MQKQKKDQHFVKQPFFKGGNTEFRKFVKKELKYPTVALKEKVEGVVVLKIDIDYKGDVTSSKVVSGIGHGCDREAQRIMMLAKYEVPKGPRKMRVRFHKTVRIQFKIPKVNSKAVVPKIASTKANNLKNPSKLGATKSFQYTIEKSKKPISQKKEGEKAKKDSYSYRIIL